MIAAAVFAAFISSVAFFRGTGEYVHGIFVYMPVAVCVSVVLSRIIHWYCNTEQYGGFKNAITDFTTGGFLMPGVLIGTYLTALFISSLRISKSRLSLLDSMAPGLSFVIGIISFADIYTDICRGKIIILDPAYMRLPFAVPFDAAGVTEYRLAVFFLRFIAMMIVTVILMAFCISSRKAEYKEGTRKTGHTYYMFLLLYGMVEIIFDSMRYDSAHLYFPGEALAALNKGASFMGLSQFLGALCCIFVFVYYLTVTIKSDGFKLYHALTLLLFLIGIGVGGFSEYLVQRYSSMYLTYYLTMTAGVLLMALSVFILYKHCILKKNMI